MKSLQAYTQAKKALDAFREKYPVLATLEQGVSDCLKGVKAEAQELIEKGVTRAENDDYAVRIDQPKKRMYDYALFAQYAKPKDIKAAESAIEKTINVKAFQELVKRGQIAIELERKSYKEIDLPIRVTIQEKKDEAT